MDGGFASLLDQGRALARAGKDADALAYFRALQRQYPTEPLASFELASALDGAGREDEAIPAYERALSLGIAGDDLARTLVGLGSSLRVVGRYDEAVTVLGEACQRLPDYLPARLFRALALASDGRSTEAVADLVEAVLALAADARMDGYRPALHHYAAALRTRVRTAAPEGH